MLKIAIISVLCILIILGIYIYVSNKHKQNFELKEHKNVNTKLIDMVENAKPGSVLEQLKKPKSVLRALRALDDEPVPEQNYPDYVLKNYCPGGLCNFLGRGYNLGQLNINSPNDFANGHRIFTDTGLNLYTNKKCLPFFLETGLNKNESLF